MTRTRTKSDARTLDERFNANSRPPMEALPSAIKKLLAEYDNLITQESLAKSELRELINGWTARETAARRTDGQGHIDAVRTGNLNAGTPATDALHAARASAEAKARSYSEAIMATALDLATARDNEWEKNNARYKADEQKARETVAAAVANLEAAVNTLTARIGLREWFQLAEQYDPSAAISLHDLMVAAGQSGTNRSFDGKTYFTMAALTRVLNEL